MKTHSFSLPTRTRRPSCIGAPACILGMAMTAAAAALIGTAPVMAKDRIAGPIPAVIEKIVDGDTVRVRAKIWIGQELAVSVRIAKIDAPELFRPKCAAEKHHAYAAKSFVQSFFPGDVVWLHDIEAGKYSGRVIARLTNRDGKDLGTALVAENFAVTGKRGTWC